MKKLIGKLFSSEIHLFSKIQPTKKPKSLSSSVKNDFLGSRGAGDDDLEEIKHPLHKNNVKN